MMATRPFRFDTEAVLTRMTNRRARSLGELREGLRIATGSMVFYHTYCSLLERHYVPGFPQNDFAHWVDRSLRMHALGERLAAVDVYDATDLQELRNRLVDVLDEHFAGGGEDPAAPADEEFHFLDAVRVSSPTSFVAEDLATFREALTRVGVRSIYHHFLTARLRLGRRTNDFSVWLGESLNVPVLARAFERIDPAVGTLEDSRTRMVSLLDDGLGARPKRRVLSAGIVGATILGAIAAGAKLRGKRDRGHGPRP